MRRWILFSFLVATLAGAVAAAQTRQLKVKLTYQGNGVVDAEHRLWVFVFDTPDFNEPGVIPIGMGSSQSNGEAIDIPGLSASTVYLATMYDEQGGYLAMGPPNSGSPVGIHGDATGPAAIELESETEVEIFFDDSFRMP